MIVKLEDAAVNTEEILYMIPEKNRTKVVLTNSDFYLMSDFSVDEILEKIAAAKG